MVVDTPTSLTYFESVSFADEKDGNSKYSSPLDECQLRRASGHGLIVLVKLVTGECESFYWTDSCFACRRSSVCPMRPQQTPEYGPHARREDQSTLGPDRSQAVSVKPRGMRWRTYRRLCEEAEGEATADNSLLATLSRPEKVPRRSSKFEVKRRIRGHMRAPNSANIGSFSNLTARSPRPRQVTRTLSLDAARSVFIFDNVRPARETADQALQN